jgi:hypothetical protein
LKGSADLRASDAVRQLTAPPAERRYTAVSMSRLDRHSLGRHRLDRAEGFSLVEAMVALAAVLVEARYVV